MNKQRQDPDIKALARKDVFKKVADGDWYQYAKEPKLQKIVKTSAQRIQKINQLAIEDDEQAMRELKQLLPHAAADVDIYFPITSIEYPNNLTVGARTFINANLQILSAGQVTIGKDCFIGPNCQLYTPNHHPSNPVLRREGWQYDLPITIGDDCWFGGSVIVLPGVKIGDNVVIGAGSVVTKDIPSNTMAAGNPARVIKQMPEIHE
ncbi:acetyltransferase [Weissella koreensis KACC 15510]|uniref:sugar O-acetyltransferase n=1 Tax=Weissella koreensis TaxID=165096 RepID=UPI0002174947|nr:sugar O-acetyltransferase [Weissella koreensis]AEJ23793.1 acetyltransferase [Weissella koreensis KACC 15510]